MTAERREQFLENVLQLSVVCPHENSNPSFCPLHEVRKLPPEQRMEWVHMLTDQDFEYIAAYHQFCLQRMSDAA
jgi:hypothetical protein